MGNGDRLTLRAEMLVPITREGLTWTLLATWILGVCRPSYWVVPTLGVQGTLRHTYHMYMCIYI